MNEQTIDQRADAARTQLRAATAARPIPPVGRVTVAGGRRVLGWRPLAAIGLAAACVVGIALVVRNDSHDTRQPAGGVPDPRRVIDDLPDGFEATGAFGPGDGIVAAEELWAGWWITDPTLSQVALVMPTAAADTPNPMAGAGYSPAAVTSVTIDGHDATLFDSIEQGAEGVRWLVLHGDTEWYTITARNIDDTTLIEIGRVALDDAVTASEIPSGFELVGVAPVFWSMARTPHAEGEGLPTGLCGVGYQRTTIARDGSTNLDAVVLTTTTDTRMSTAQLALYFPSRTQVPGTAYSSLAWLGDGSVHLLAWQIGGVSYLMLGTVTIDELVTSANSVRVPTDDEWAALVAQAAASGAETSSTGSSSVSAPATTFAIPVPETTVPNG